MELRITAFRGSPWTRHSTHEAVLEVRGRNADPDKLLGAHLVWRTQTGRVVRGKVVKRHGHDGGHKVLARFHKGLPGQALGTTVEVRGAKEQKAAKRSVKPAKEAAPAKPKPAPKPAEAKVRAKASERPKAPAAARGKEVRLVFQVESKGSLEISGTQFDAPGSDKGKGLAGEYVELTNKGSTPADLSGWTLKDEKDHVYKFPDGFKLAPGKHVKVRTGKGTSSATDLYWGRGAAVWNNDGDTASLVDPQGRTQATRKWRPEA